MSDSVSKLLIERYGVMVFLVVIFVLAIIAILHFGIKFDIGTVKILSQIDRGGLGPALL